MPLTSAIDVFIAGTFGGFLLELMHWWNLRRRSTHFPQYARSPFYWGVTLLMAGAGGLLAVVYFGQQAEALIALHVGLSAPLILQKLSASMVQPGARSTDRARLIDFLSW